jgi:hypothetical protein
MSNGNHHHMHIFTLTRCHGGTEAPPPSRQRVRAAVWTSQHLPQLSPFDAYIGDVVGISCTMVAIRPSPRLGGNVVPRRKVSLNVLVDIRSHGDEGCLAVWMGDRHISCLGANYAHCEDALKNPRPSCLTLEQQILPGNACL